MEQIMTWAVPLLVALITGGFSYLGVAKSIKAANDKIQSDQAKQILIIGQQIDGIKEDVKRLELKQDKHNAVIERTYKLEQQVADLEKRMK